MALLGSSGWGNLSCLMDIVFACHECTVGERSDEVSQPGIRLVQVRVMAESPGGGGFLHPGLLRVQLPRMQVHDVGLLAVQDSADTRAKGAFRDEPEVGPASPGEDLVSKAHIADRDLDKALDGLHQASILRPVAFGVKGEAPVAAVEAEGVVAGVVEIAGIPNALEDGLADGKAGRAKPVHALARDVLQDVPALDQVLEQRLPRSAAAELVPAAVGRYLVAPGVDFANQARETLGNPGEDEEGGPMSCWVCRVGRGGCVGCREGARVQQVQQPMGAVLHPELT